MAEQPFPTKWHFLRGRVLFAVKDATGQFLAYQSGEGGYVMPLWTDQAAATRAVPDGYTLYHGEARERIDGLAEGMGMILNPDTEISMDFPAWYVDQLRPLTGMFPGGATVTIGEWEPPPQVWDGVRRLAKQYTFVRSIRALAYQVENGPVYGLLAYEAEGGPEGDDSITDALFAALAKSGRQPRDMKVEGVQVLALSDVPPELQDYVTARRPVYRPRK
jgi:hypothetical protein